MGQWQYLFFTVEKFVGEWYVTVVDNEHIYKKGEQRLNDYLAIIGQEGWEVVGSSGDIFICKRPLEKEQP